MIFLTSKLRNLMQFPIMPKKNTREFWAWLNIMFNLVDQKRIKEVGPDRACAEWVLRNGASVTFAGEQATKDYNFLARLPPSMRKQLIAIDASDASITFHGFRHFEGCQHLKSLKFHKNPYVNDDALISLETVKESLTQLHLSSCESVTDKGVLSLIQLSKLSELTLFDLRVKDWKNCESELSKALPSCHLKINQPQEPSK